MTRFLFSFAGLALVIASAAGSSYRVNLFQSSVVNGTELQPGEYKLEVKQDRAILSRGKQVAEVPVKIETTPQKVGTTSVKYVNGQIQEIRIGGTNTKLLF
jgi:hypothetical protein